MNTTIKIDDWEFYCCATEDKKGGEFTAKWIDLLDGQEGFSYRHRSEKEALTAAKNGANNMCGFKYKQKKMDGMDEVLDLIHGKKKE
jgi:hypothetical protein